MTDVQELLEFLGCPLADKNFKPVPESEIKCRYDACVWGGGVASVGVCHRGNPRAADCQGFRQECPACQGDGGWNGHEATCRTCGGTGWVDEESRPS